MNKRFFGLIISSVSIIIGLIIYIFNIQIIAMSNVFFILGLLLVVIGAVMIIAKGHLFTGWRIFHRKGDNERFENEKIPAKEIGSKKNESIVINDFAKLFLTVGIIWILIAILITL
ncbi:DUF3899 domain-containing protein [Apilactobacillus micheneri]|uniref:DUF3899 domain-containing protein n=2 Tax=Apilactobacillus micheneri TaxID=1899430 RepID=A0A9Q8MTQ2_9LACO|nr:DUF3899 domain-containing protein [Apilactobacillus micheneri]TPR38790.1 DUF3899 domain-containing protein [Apilactobacillus micheneri]TPR41324.1 DUF3899 domain-containing protein [Apilactobacillus micheneri]TPR43018.1 DUF3899 domain-containing protein [Apilactobacillus micheneri]TPR43304.1 DUF3899 domain-containing protein [Apilactobacillus micheneri]TPR43966.1 DUF3899 domain-containing protein [Apilactobacillus micheneri]